jgi:DNA-3-methyladenine glycosylase II
MPYILAFMDLCTTISADSPAVRHLRSVDGRLASVIDAIGDLECREHPDAFAFIAGEIIEQMLSVKAAESIRARIRTLCGGRLTPEALLTLTQDDLRRAGLSKNKAGYLLGFALAVHARRLDLSTLYVMTDDDVMEHLTAIRGIGSWTAKMCLIFVLGREDILPFEDSAFMHSFRWLYGKAAPSREDIFRTCAKWRPYSSIAARYLYRALDMGMVK